MDFVTSRFFATQVDLRGSDPGTKQIVFQIRPWMQTCAPTVPLISGGSVFDPLVLSCLDLLDETGGQKK